MVCAVSLSLAALFPFIPKSCGEKTFLHSFHLDLAQLESIRRLLKASTAQWKAKIFCGAWTLSVLCQAKRARTQSTTRRKVTRSQSQLALLAFVDRRALTMHKIYVQFSFQTARTFHRAERKKQKKKKLMWGDWAVKLSGCLDSGRLCGTYFIFFVVC